ncbi:hypothetical protein Syun_000499 [Stephania yunnanensis]|uniref:non-specific serine/threonine protein kinase n=1 Tax=Stephania yunnanensis TaxID=152371 RepID=A0AAP0LG35_9MAGN
MASHIKASQFVSIFVIILALNLNFSSLLGQRQRDNFVYNGFIGSNLQLDGLAEIKPDGLLQLTNLTIQQTAHAYHPFVINFKNSSSFSTTFMFAIVSERANRNGHGFAFTISPSHIEGGSDAEYLGILNVTNNGSSSNHIFAVEVDTARSLEFGDRDNNHVGIDVNSLNSVETATAAYFNEKVGRNDSLHLSSGDTIQVWIDYDGVKKRIEVALAPIGVTRPRIPLLSTQLDLSLVFVDRTYVGFSASTGLLQSSQYILGWSFNIDGKAQKLDVTRLPPVPRRKEPKERHKQTIGLSVGMVMVVLITLLGGLYIVRRKSYDEIREDWEKEYGPQRFSYKDLYKATEGFKDKALLGSGGFGKVYRGTLLKSKVEVAIKRVSHESTQGMKEFIAEIASLGKLRHRNMVPLQGYCRRSGELLLVYDYMPNGSLDKYLFTNERLKLSWTQRYKILQGVASALVYLHEEWEQVVLHRDVKASNVVLDADFNGRLGDFGLARLYQHGEIPQTTRVVGTLGYLAPELTRTGKATTMTDVFAFGAFMLEVACGRRPVEQQELPEKMILVDWVHDCWRKGSILETSDPSLGDDYVMEHMELVLKLGLLCSHPSPDARPSMRHVLHCLDGEAFLSEQALEGFPTDAASATTLVIGDGSSSVAASNASSPPQSCSVHTALSSGR